MAQSTVKTIKTAKKEALLFRELSNLFLRLTLEEPRLHGMNITRIDTSRDGGICYIFFYTPEGEADFAQKLSLLVLYKPSLRKSLAHSIHARYTPELVFKFDNTFEKQSRLEALLDSVKATTEPETEE